MPSLCCAMHAALERITQAVPPAGATVIGWPWWAVAGVLFLSCAPAWAMAWLDVLDRVRGLFSPPGSTATSQEVIEGQASLTVNASEGSAAPAGDSTEPDARVGCA